MELLEKRNSEYEKKIEQITDKAKAQIKKGNKQAARTLMIKKKNYQKFLENSQNTILMNLLKLLMILRKGKMLWMKSKVA